ncbi:hypothetical protein HanPI659440_Chr12g0455301 [Helianthus annuus]|nr:hypothetical protein HanPI659440_Chr12g0455301 [Helianthus annuus]
MDYPEEFLEYQDTWCSVCGGSHSVEKCFIFLKQNHHIRKNIIHQIHMIHNYCFSSTPSSNPMHRDRNPSKKPSSLITSNL